MRFFKPLLGAVLVISVLVNIVLIYKVRGKRAIISVNGAPITRTDMDRYLEQTYGPQYKAMMVERLLVDQEAHQDGVAPTDAEVQELFDTKRELEWSYAQKLERQPWLEDEAKQEIKLVDEEEHLLAKDVPVTDEEILLEYQTNPQLYDTPNKAKCTVAAVLNDNRTDSVKSMMVSQTPAYSAATIAGNYPRDVIFLGDHNQFTFAQPYGTKLNNVVFSMEPRSVRVQAAGDLGQLGAKKVIIRLDEIIPGKVADPNDPKIRKKIKLNVALHHAGPVSELIASLWQKGNLIFDDQADKSYVELVLFPNKQRSDAK